MIILVHQLYLFVNLVAFIILTILFTFIKIYYYKQSFTNMVPEDINQVVIPKKASGST